MRILVDSSVWIDYFRSGKNSGELDSFIEQNLICTNDLILTELVPFLKAKKKTRIIHLLKSVIKIPLEINWDTIIKYQTVCIEKGINNVGIPDLIILENVIRNDLVLYSLDKHFRLLNENFKFKLL
ncbi:MAG: PIN domain-containing protein [Chlorobi bacterium]|nr:PIN domain-containing protein [Chlorobiota bacterium]